jgi:hypothetical protein
MERPPLLAGGENMRGKVTLEEKLDGAIDQLTGSLGQYS